MSQMIPAQEIKQYEAHSVPALNSKRDTEGQSEAARRTEVHHRWQGSTSKGKGSTRAKALQLMVRRGALELDRPLALRRDQNKTCFKKTPKKKTHAHETSMHIII